MVSDTRILALTLAVACCPVTAAPDAQRESTAAEKTQETQDVLVVRKVFHVAGIPGLRRNERGDLILKTLHLSFSKGKKEAVIIPYDRIRQAQLLSGERHYPKATYAAAVTTFGIGALLIMHKRQVDTLIMDYTNERGGLMGLVLQLPKGTGDQCKELLVSRGVKLVEPTLQ